MFTYVVYNFILFGATFSAYLYEQSRSKSAKLVFMLVSFFIPFIFLAIRYDIGTDYQSYVKIFERVSSGIIVFKEPGFILINQIVAYLELNVQWVFVLSGFITFFFAYKALPKEGFALGVFLLIAIFYLYEGYSAIRQGMAIAIMAYAMKYIYTKEFKKYLLWSIFAMMFHFITGILLLFIYPFANKRFNRFILISIIIILFISVKFTHIAELLFQLVGVVFPKYSWYLNSQFAEEATTSFGLLGPLVKIGIGIVVIFFSDRIIKKYPIANIALNLYVLYLISFIFHLKISIFGRVEHVFIFSVILSLVYFAKTFEKKGRVIIICIVGLFYYLMFMRYIANGTYSVESSVYVNPYQTVLFK